MYHGQRVPGFPAHPHRGFETVTIVEQGVVDHSDSLGAGGRFGSGDVQWMTAGHGVQHCEMFPLLNRDADNPLEFFQIWLNLPRANKLVPAHFAMLWNDTIPTFTATDEHGLTTSVRVIAGHVETVLAPAPAPQSWAADPAHEVAIWIIRMDPGAEWTLPVASANVNRSVYFYAGASTHIAGTLIDSHQSVELHAEQEVDLKNGPSESYVLLLQGQPISETVAQHGPFVMNTQAEIHDAVNEYRATEFGRWPWPSRDHVHPRERSRFARYPDGTEEVKPN